MCFCVHIYKDLDDSGVDLTMDIDIQEATGHIRTTPGTFTSDRPTVGIKRPRTHLGSRANKCPRRQTQSDPDCSRCDHLLAEIEELKESNALLTEHLNQCRLQAANAINQSEAPKPGKVSQALVESHQVRHYFSKMFLVSIAMICNIYSSRHYPVKYNVI